MSGRIPERGHSSVSNAPLHLLKVALSNVMSWDILGRNHSNVSKAPLHFLRMVISRDILWDMLERSHSSVSNAALFTQKGYLKAHLLTHTWERPLKCKQCPRHKTHQENSGHGRNMKQYYIIESYPVLAHSNYTGDESPECLLITHSETPHK